MKKAKVTTIYGLLKGDEIVYVGRTVNVPHRLSQHRTSGKDFDGYRVLDLCYSEAAAQESEAACIKKYSPRLNVVTASFPAPYADKEAERPVSVRLGAIGTKLADVARRTGLKQPEILKAALYELFTTYPDDRALALAVFNHRTQEAAK